MSNSAMRFAECDKPHKFLHTPDDSDSVHAAIRRQMKRAEPSATRGPPGQVERGRTTRDSNEHARIHRKRCSESSLVRAKRIKRRGEKRSSASKLNASNCTTGAMAGSIRRLPPWAYRKASGGEPTKRVTSRRSMRVRIIACRATGQPNGDCGALRARLGGWTHVQLREAWH